MSYRAFKRLLGETSLERKCRFLFGAAVLVLLTLSLGLYAYHTERTAYDQPALAAKLLVRPAVTDRHLPFLQAVKDPELWGDTLQATFSIDKNQYYFLTEKTPFDDSHERNLFNEFAQNKEKTEETKLRPAEQLLYYYEPIRLRGKCLECHQKLARNQRQPLPAENSMIAMVRIRMDTSSIEQGIHWSRALLMATALVTALLIMLGSWLIVRYIIVKPVKHLKEVSDAISAGELNVRSEIQTGDEFEDLSHAFNRMLRNLVSMQDQWRKVNADLDRKVDELAQANMALYESNRLKSDFLATMSHELRTPLNSILGFSEVLSSGDSLSDKQQRWVANIRASGQRLLALINDILDLAKIEAGKMHVRVEDFSLQDVCDGLLNMFRPLAEKKNIDLRGELDSAIPTLRQDVTKLQQILQNLLSNAIKFTPEGGRVLLQADADARHVMLTVSDTGVGIAPEEQELVFQKFRQSGNPLTREHAGTGLGLSIVRELCKLLGGEITLQSELGRGSTFTVRVPLQLSEEPRLEFDLADERIDLSKAQRVDVRLYANAVPGGEKTEIRNTNSETNPKSA
jgi:signal transduction histidine kinase